MKRFLITISCLLAVTLGLLACVYVGGVSLGLDKEQPLTLQARTRGKELQLAVGETWETLEIRGVNLGSGLPGHWSTDYAIDAETYLRWFELIQAMGANVIRVYSVQNPAFYKALDTFNSGRETPLYLLQGVWVNDYAQNSHMDAYDAAFRQRLLEDCAAAVDALHGKRFLMKNDAGSSAGLYRTDVSQWVLGYIIGGDWVDVTVAYTDERYPDHEGYQGDYLRTGEDATAFEALLAEVGDSLIGYETARYHQQRLVAFASGKTTDPFAYPEDVTAFFRKCAAIDPEHIQSTERFQAGLFASYSAYAYDLDYLSVMDPAEWAGLTEPAAELSDCDGTAGAANTYRAYLKLLNRHHTMPVVISEFGAATGRGMAQRNTESGQREGYLSEAEQAQALVDCYRDIQAAGCAGGCVFSWQDEWHKRTWNTMYAVDFSRCVYWSDAQSNDQHFGLLAFEPGETAVCAVDGDVSEWTDQDVVMTYEDGSSVSMKYDAAYVYLRIYKPGLVFGQETLYVPIDTTRQTGSTVCANRGVTFDRAADFLLVLEGRDSSALLVQDRYHPIHANYEMELTGTDAYIDPPDKDSSRFEVVQMAVKDAARQYWDDETTLDAFETGRLRWGDANPDHAAYDSLADFMARGENVELRLPWELLNVSDPSRMRIHEDYYDGNYGVEFQSLKELALGLGTGDGTIAMGTAALKGWGNQVTYHERLKPAYDRLRECWTEGETG